MRFSNVKIVLMTFALIFASIQFNQAQEISDSIDKPSKIGIGASMFSSNSIYVTIDLNERFRIEPFFGFRIHERSQFGFHMFGIGAFKKQPLGKFNFLYGVRAGFADSGNKFIAPTMGGEYRPIKNFSIGAEISIWGRISEGNNSASTGSAMIFRFYW